MKKHPIFLFSFSFVFALTIVALIIFGFDIDTPKNSRRALTQAMKNESTVNRFYRINDNFAFGVFTDRAPGEMDVSVTAYDLNYVPYCMFCGWYTNSSTDNRRIMQPYMAGDMVYGIEAREEDYAGVPKGAYPTLNLSTGEYGFVTDLSQVTDNATDAGKRLGREYVSENYDEMSFSSSDDEDCFIVFSALFVCYIVLIIWGSVILLGRLMRKK